MLLILKRTNYNEKSTEGVLLVDGVEFCHTLEDTDRELEINGDSAKVYGETSIPKGEYTIDITMSPRFKVNLPILLDVPYFTGVRIHKGNKPEDTEGCILVGSLNEKGTDNWISQSKPAFDKLMKVLLDAKSRKEEIKIIVT